MESRSFYGADDRLRMFQTYDVRRTDWSNYTMAGVWEEYRYDALGRRVLLRTRADGGLCDVDPWTCTSSVTHFVWAGDNLLWELKKAEGSYAAQAGGNVSYFHAGGVDRPLVITKDGQSVIPHQNWRGQFARGTYPSGYRSDCTSYPANGCTPIQWPGERTSARHELEPDGRIQNWHGGLVDGMRDASGQMYMRNRYYDPQTGQFTQTDPIGLAGGLNAYGFAAGDPVSYSDPYGLSPCCPWIRGRLSGEEAEQVLRGVNEKLEGVRPTLNTLGMIIISVGPAGEVGALFQAFRVAKAGRNFALGLEGSSVLGLTTRRLRELLSKTCRLPRAKQLRPGARFRAQLRTRVST